MTDEPIWTPRCAGCDVPVDNVGDTCSLACYQHMYSMVARYMQVNGDVPEGVPLPQTLEFQPWYEEEQEKIKKRADTHEINSDSVVHKGE